MELLVQMLWSLPVYQQQEGLFWFIPLIAAAVIWGTVIIICGDSYPDVKSFAILGMQGASKTQFIYNLRNKKYDEYEATLGIEEYGTFSFKLNNGKNITVKGCKDIPGGEEWISEYYGDFIRNNEFLFFLFNGYNYVNDYKYRISVQARMEFVHRNYLNGKAKGVYVFATFADQFKSKEERQNAITEIKSSVNGKTYAGFLSNFCLLDMRDKDELMNILSQIFPNNE
jgi:hypothetical protein